MNTRHGLGSVLGWVILFRSVAYRLRIMPIYRMRTPCKLTLRRHYKNSRKQSPHSHPISVYGPISKLLFYLDVVQRPAQKSFGSPSSKHVTNDGLWAFTVNCSRINDATMIMLFAFCQVSLRLSRVESVRSVRSRYHV